MYNTKIIILVSFLITTILSFTLFLKCSTESTEPPNQEPIDLTGSWELTSTITSNSCGPVDGSSITEPITIIQCGNEVSVITGGGLWGSGTLQNDRLDFTGTEIQTDDMGCQSTNQSSGTLTVTASTLEGTLTTNITFDPDSCGAQPPCNVESTARLSLTAVYQSSCIDRDEFGNPASSDYILPWPVSKSYVLNNGYCFPLGGHRRQLAYDFLIPIGDTILASRSGMVRAVKESSPDNGQGSDHNHVMIEHNDGTVAFYAHLKQLGVIVKIGDNVVAGQPIALAGHSGTTDVVHLHFGVYNSWPPTEGFDQAINFKNTDGLVDCRDGLVTGETYTAK